MLLIVEDLLIELLYDKVISLLFNQLFLLFILYDKNYYYFYYSVNLFLFFIFLYKISFKELSKFIGLINSNNYW